MTKKSYTEMTIDELREDLWGWNDESEDRLEWIEFTPKHGLRSELMASIQRRDERRSRR